MSVLPTIGFVVRVVEVPFFDPNAREAYDFQGDSANSQLT